MDKLKKPVIDPTAPVVDKENPYAKFGFAGEEPAQSAAPTTTPAPAASVNPYAKFGYTEDLAAPVAPVAKEDSYLSGTVKALGRGLAEIPVAAGHALEWDASDPAGINKSLIERAGKAIADTGEGLRDAIPQPNPGDSKVKQAWVEGVESLPLSAAYAVPSMIGAAGAGLLATPETLGAGTIPAAIAGAAAGQALTYPVMQRSTAQQTFEELRKLNPNATPEELNQMATDASATGHWEAAPEAVGNIAEGVIYGVMPGGRAAKVGVDFLTNIFRPGVKQFGKNALKSYAFEAPTEAITAYKQTEIFNKHVAPGNQEDPAHAALWSLAPTAVMTGLMGAGGTASQRLRGMSMEKELFQPLPLNEQGLLDPKALQSRYALAKVVGAEAEKAGGPEVKAAWEANARSAIAANQPIPFDGTAFVPPEQAPAVLAEELQDTERRIGNLEATLQAQKNNTAVAKNLERLHARREEITARMAARQEEAIQEDQARTETAKFKDEALGSTIVGAEPYDRGNVRAAAGLDEGTLGEVVNPNAGNEVIADLDRKIENARSVAPSSKAAKANLEAMELQRVQIAETLTKEKGENADAVPKLRETGIEDGEKVPALRAQGDEVEQRKPLYRGDSTHEDGIGEGTVGDLGKGIYFTEDSISAEYFTDGSDKTHTREFQPTYEKPFDLMDRNIGESDGWKKMMETVPEGLNRQNLEKWAKGEADIKNPYGFVARSFGQTKETFNDFLASHGYDSVKNQGIRGISDGGTEIVVFDKGKVKPAEPAPTEQTPTPAPLTTEKTPFDAYKEGYERSDKVMATAREVKSVEKKPHVVYMRMRGRNMGDEIGIIEAPYDGTLEDAARVAAGLRFYASEEYDGRISLRETDNVATDETGEARYTMTQGAGQMDVQEVPRKTPQTDAVPTPPSTPPLATGGVIDSQPAVATTKAPQGQPGEPAIKSILPEKTQTFIRNKVKELLRNSGSIEAVKRFYSDDTEVSRFAHAVAAQEMAPDAAVAAASPVSSVRANKGKSYFHARYPGKLVRDYTVTFEDGKWTQTHAAPTPEIARALAIEGRKAEEQKTTPTASQVAPQPTNAPEVTPTPAPTAKGQKFDDKGKPVSAVKAALMERYPDKPWLHIDQILPSGNKEFDDEQRAIEQDAIDQVMRDPEAAVQEYLNITHQVPVTDKAGNVQTIGKVDIFNRPVMKDGKQVQQVVTTNGKRSMEEIMQTGPVIVNTDEARPLFAAYRDNPGRFSAAVHEASSAVGKMVWGQAVTIADPRGKHQILFLGGGGGSGKGSALSKHVKQDGDLYDLAQMEKESQIVYDGTLNDFKKLSGLIELATENGADLGVRREIFVTHVFRRMDQAIEGIVDRKWTNGIVGPDGRVIPGRDVPYWAAAIPHFNSGSTFLEMADALTDNEDVVFIGIDNTGNFKPRPVSLDNLTHLIYTKTKGRTVSEFIAEVKDLYEAADLNHPWNPNSETWKRGEEDGSNPRRESGLPGENGGAPQEAGRQAGAEDTGSQSPDAKNSSRPGTGNVQEHRGAESGRVSAGLPSLDEFDALFVEVNHAEEAKKQAAIALKEAAEAVKGLLKNITDPNKLGSGPTFDDKMYQQIRPHLQAAWRAAKLAYGESKEAVVDFVKKLIDAIGADVQPYARKFYGEILDGSAETEQGNDTERNGSPRPAALENGEQGSVRPDGDGRDASERIPGSGDTDTVGDRNADAGGDGRGRSLDTEPGVVHSGGPGEELQGSVDDLPTPASEPRPLKLSGTNPGNYRITEKTRLGEGTRGQRLENNLAAIRLVKQLTSEQRHATPDEQDILARYVGWGGLKNVFDPTSKAPQDQKARKELESLLTKEEFFDARQSVLNAHYTSKEVIDSIYAFVRHFGFTGGHVLEPTYGAGNFLGLMPDDMAASSKWYGSELDPITARIGQFLYPDAQLLHSGFQVAEFPYGRFDMAIGNPPFGDTRITDTNKKRSAIDRFKIHNYVIAKAGMHLKPGGIMPMVVTSRFLDTANPEARDYLAQNFKLLTAVRLPNNAFAKNAGTEVTTDLVFFQRLMPGEAPDLKAAWLETGATMQNAAGEKITVNKHFADNPQLMLGEPSMQGTMYGGNREEFTLNPRPGQDTTALINEILANAEDLKDIITKNADAQADALAVTIELNREDVGIGGFYMAGDNVMMREDDDDSGNPVFVKLTPDTVWGGQAQLAKEALAQANAFLTANKKKDDNAAAVAFQLFKTMGKNFDVGKKSGKKSARQEAYEKAIADPIKNMRKVIPELEATMQRGSLGAKNLERIKGMLNLRALTYQLIEAERFDKPEIELLRRKLNNTYNLFVAKFGYINADENASLLSDDIKIEFGLEEKYRKPITAERAKKLGIEPLPATAKKAPIFTTRLFFPQKEITSAADAHDGYGISLSERGRLDIPYIAQLTGLSDEQVIKDLSAEGLIYLDPTLKELAEDFNNDLTPDARDALNYGWVQEDQYLSGNVKAKHKAIAFTTGMEKNAAALKGVFPEDVKTEQIFADMGATWIPGKIYQEFLDYLGIKGAKVSVQHAVGRVTAIGGKAEDNQININLKNENIELVELFNLVANKKPVVVWDKDGDTRTVNKEKTKELVPKVKLLKATFKDWLFADTMRAGELTKIYNDTQNTHAKRTFNGKHLRMVGNSPAIRMRKVQKDAVWRGIQSPVVMLDHCVGSGKTYTIIATVMERKRLGLTKKAAIVVPNHIVGQWAKSWMKLYPGARILAATEKDFSAKNRRRLLARIATGNYDAIIMGHSSFGFIPMEAETERKFIQEEVSYLERALIDAQAAEDKRTVRTITNRINAKMERIKTLMNKQRDDVVTFENTGIDYLTIDESHEFKNLEYSSAMQNVVGMGSQKGAKKSFDLYSKLQYLLGQNGGAAFATGTPISNSLVEMYTILRYLNRSALKDRQIEAFDSWVRNYASVEVKTEYTSTQKLKERQVMAGFNNLPELLQLYAEVADSITMKDLKRITIEENHERNVKDGTNEREEFPVPKIKGGQRQLDVADPTEEQAIYMDYLVARAERLESEGKSNDPKTDNALWIMSDARKMALDIRLVDPNGSDHPDNKVHRAVNFIERKLKESEHQKGTVLVFCDLSTPGKTAGSEARTFINRALDRLGLKKDERTKKLLAEMSYSEQWQYLQSKIRAEIDRLEPLTSEEDNAKQEAYETFLENIDRDEESALTTVDSGFSVYDEVKRILIEDGVPENEIAFIHDPTNNAQKTELFERVNAGQVRVLIGSSKKMGAGTNVQHRVVAEYHMDAPWRPSDIEQREGRVIRQGNELYLEDPDNFEVEIMAASTRSTFDTVMWQILQRKAEMLEQFRAGVRSFVEESSDSASYADFMAESTGNPAFKEKFQLEREIEELESEQRNVAARRAASERIIKNAEKDIAVSRKSLADAQHEAKLAAEATDFKYEGKTYPADMAAAEEAFELNLKEEFKVYEKALDAYIAERDKAIEPQANELRAKVKAEEITVQSAEKLFANLRTDYDKAHKDEKPKQPEGVTTRRLAKTSKQAGLILEIEKYFAETDKGDRIIWHGGLEIEISKEPGTVKDKFNWEVTINRAPYDKQQTKEAGQLIVEALNPRRIQRAMGIMVNEADYWLESREKAIKESSLVLENVTFDKDAKLEKMKTRYVDVVEEVQRLEAEISDRRAEGSNPYVDADRARFPNGIERRNAPVAKTPDVMKPKPWPFAPEQGIPYDQRPKAKPYTEKQMIDVANNNVKIHGLYFAGNMQGGPWFSNGSFAMKGEAERSNQDFDITDSLEKILTAHPVQEPAELIAYHEGKENGEAWTAKGQAYNARYLDRVAKDHPGTVWQETSHPDGMLIAKVDEQPVAVVMAYGNKHEVPPGVQALMENRAGTNGTIDDEDLVSFATPDRAPKNTVAFPLLLSISRAAKLADGWSVKAVRTAADLPAEIQATMQEKGIRLVEGVKNKADKTVYLVQSGLSSPRRAKQVLAHETFHVGVINTELQGYVDSLPAGAVAKFKADNPAYQSLSDLGIANEMLAKESENHLWVKRIIGKINTWLKSIGIDLQITLADAYSLIDRAMRNATRPDGPKGGQLAFDFAAAWHGGPQGLGKLSTAAVGSRPGGEQRHGWGIYLSSIKEVAELYKSRIEESGRPGSVYSVEIAPEEDEYLLWDEPLSKQSAKVKAAIKELAWEKDLAPLSTGDLLGGVLYKRIRDLRGARQASEYLHSIGIRGIKYLDGSGQFRTYQVANEGTTANPRWVVHTRDILDKIIATLKFTDEKAARSFEKDHREKHNYVVFDDADVSITGASPQLFYHGTDADFDSFKIPSWFTTNKQVAGIYGANRQGPHRVIPVKLNVTNPIDLPFDTLKNFTKGQVSSYQLAGFDGARAILKETGETVVVPFAPEQVKSVFRTDNDLTPQFSAKGGIDPNGTIAQKFDLPTEHTTLGAIKGVFAADHFTREQIKKTLDKARTQLVDRLHPIEELGSVPYMMHRLAGNAHATLTTFLQHGKLTWKDGVLTVATKDKGFLPWLQKMKDNDGRDLFYWMAVKRAEVLEREGRENWLDKPSREKILTEILGPPSAARTAKEQEFERLNAEFQEWNRNIIDVAQQSGLLSLEQIDAWTRDFYLPFYRILENKQTHDEFLAAPHKSKQHISAQIRRLKGGEEKLGNPIENIMRNWAHLVNESQRNIARTAAGDAALDMGLAEEVPASELVKILGTSTTKRWKIRREGAKYASEILDDYEDAKAYKDMMEQKSGKTYDLIEEKIESVRFGRKEDFGIVSFQRDGKTTYLRVPDTELFEAMSEVNIKMFDSPLFKVMGFTKRLLTQGATFSPAFRIANLLRDTVHTAIVSKNFVPFVSSAKGLAQVWRQSDDYIELMATGAGFGQGYIDSADPKAMARAIERLVKRHGQGVKGSVLDTPRKALAFWERIGHASEMAARVQLYSTLKAQGKDTLTAAYEARDLLDFHRSGASAAVRYLAGVTPFINARIQGLDRLYRGYKQDPKAFLTKGGMVAAASMLLWMIYRDDDRYKELEDWEKWQYHHAWIGGEHIRIPKAFEVGAIFASLFESGAAVLDGQEDMDFFGRFLWETLTQTFAVNAPAMISPALEIYANKSGFTGRPIESLASQRLPAGQRGKPWTPQMLKDLGAMTNISPVKMEALIQGHTATYGTLFLTVADSMYRNMIGAPARPDMTINDIPAVGRFVRDDTGKSKYATRYYEFAHEVGELTAQVSAFKALGDFEAARNVAKSEPYKYRKLVNHTNEQINVLTRQEKRIFADKEMTGTVKRQKLDAIALKKLGIYRRAYTQIYKKDLQ